MAKAASRRGNTYRVTDLNYPAVSAAIPTNAVGAKIGGGKAYTFGRSVNSGVSTLLNYYTSVMRSCPSTSWVLGGYSQGAMVVAQAVRSFNASKVVYVGLFGDPQTYLPEGKGLFPKACSGRNLSSYRVFVPECKTNTGALGTRVPYVPSGLNGKIGLWCNRRDYVCGSTKLLFNNGGHMKYVEYGHFNWMSSIVEQKLPRRRAVVADEEIEEVDDVIEAHLSTDDYQIEKSGTAVLDASGSFSMGHEIAEYQWSVNNGEFWSTGTEATLERTLSYPEQEKVTLRVIDDVGNRAETTATVTTQESVLEETIMAEPDNVTAEYENGEIILSWPQVDEEQARYLLVRLNGVDLNYLPADEQKATVSDVEDVMSAVLEVAWLDEEYELGKWTKVPITGNVPKTVADTPVETGVMLSVLPGVGVLLMIVLWLNKKYLPR